MNRQISIGAFFVLLMVAAWPFDTFADGMAVKCAPNEERAWLYDSVTTLNVAAKLKCGENVEVLGEESGYVKVRTASGAEGYLPANNLPKIPVGNHGATAAAAPVQPEQPTLASLARAAAAARHAREAASTSASTEIAGAPVAPAPSSSAQPAVAANVASAVEPKIATPVPASPAKAAAAPAAVTPVSSTTATAAAPVTASSHTPSRASTASTSSRAKAKAASKSSATTVTTNAKPSPSNPSNPAAPRPAPTANANAPVHTAVATSATRMANGQPAQPASSNDIYVTGVVNASGASNSATVRTVADTSEDDDDSYLTRPVSESDDPACQTYVSGYGLSPGQFKWLEDNRKKKYPSICPAASPAMVDYVIIFTHDVDFFNYTMPTPVHTEAGGFSDWTPMLEFDTSVISHSDIDKSRHEYVWVFHVKRGAFDPAKFSPHRKFQYNKVESKYAKTVEDALDFIQGQGANR